MAKKKTKQEVPRKEAKHLFVVPIIERIFLVLIFEQYPEGLENWVGKEMKRKRINIGWGEKAKKSFKETLESAKGAGRQFTMQDDQGKTIEIIWLRKWGNQAAAHEAVHCAYSMLDRSGISHSYENHEILAYLVDYLVQRINDVAWNQIDKCDL